MNAETARAYSEAALVYGQSVLNDFETRKRQQEDILLKQQAKENRQRLDAGINFLETLVHQVIAQATVCSQFKIRHQIAQALLSENLECNYYLAFRALVQRLETQGYQAAYYHGPNAFTLEISWKKSEERN